MASIVAPSLEESVEDIQSAAFEELLQKIHRRQAKVGIIGLGYVGLPLAIEFSRAGFSVTGFDTDGHVVDRIATALNEQGKPLRGTRVHILGVAYKRDVADVRESPALDVMHLLAERKARISYTDPYVPRLSEPDIDLYSEPISELSQKDCAVIVTDHRCFNYAEILRMAPLIVDTRNALRGFRDEKIFRL
jgi:UDP-N-acetyl-D-mannosaminuronate dehydrogenase